VSVKLGLHCGNKHCAAINVSDSTELRQVASVCCCVCLENRTCESSSSGGSAGGSSDSSYFRSCSGLNDT